MKYEIGPVTDYPSGTCNIIDVAGRSVGIINLQETYYAILNVCPHMHAPVCQGFVAGTYLPSEPGERIFGLKDQVLSCPWHFWEFDIPSGEALFGVDDRKLKHYPIAVEGDRVVVEIGR
jgi:nitrite reductase/ring-hydroxylating ferredoxin subunit